MMKKRFLTVAAMCILVSSGVFAQKIVLSTGEWAPYTGEKLPGQGLVTEIVNAASGKAGLVPQYSWVGDAWLRCEDAVKTGTAFAAFPYSKTDERAKLFDFTDAVVNGDSIIYYIEGKGKDLNWSTMKDFSGSSFIGIVGYDYVQVFKDNGLKMEPATTPELAFKMLQAGRGMYLIEDELVASAAIKAVFGADAGKVKRLTKAWKEAPYYLMVSRTYPDSKALLGKFNAGLAAIKKDGTYKTILAKYGLKE